MFQKDKPFVYSEQGLVSADKAANSRRGGAAAGRRQPGVERPAALGGRRAAFSCCPRKQLSFIRVAPRCPRAHPQGGYETLTKLAPDLTWVAVHPFIVSNYNY